MSNLLSHINYCSVCKTGKRCLELEQQRDAYVKENFGNTLAMGKLENGELFTVKTFNHGTQGSFQYSLELHRSASDKKYFLSPKAALILEEAMKKFLRPAQESCG
jgi:hypothetical protein